MTTALKIRQITQDEPIPYRLLLLADPNKTLVDRYLQTGKCFIATLDDILIGVLAIGAVSLDEIEIYNIAIEPKYQGGGHGKILLQFAVNHARESDYSSIIIKTGNSSIGQMALYQKAGFDMAGIQHNYFIENYDESIIEHGIQCKHRVLFRKSLKKENPDSR